MSNTARNPLPSSTDLLIALLSLAILLLVLGRPQGRERQPRAPEPRITLEGRMGEILRGARDAGGWARGLGWMEAAAPARREPWDRALDAILEAEGGDPARARTLALAGTAPPEPAGSAFRRCWSAAYLSDGPLPPPGDRRAVFHALRGGYGARILEARLEARSGSTSAAASSMEQARQWARERARILWAVAAFATLSLCAGTLFAGLLALRWKRPALPDPALSGRGVLIACLGWFLAYLLSGSLAQGAVALIPTLRPLALPMAYGFHAGVGLALLCGLQGISPIRMARSLAGKVRALAWAPGFLLLAAGAVLAATWALSPLLREQDSPQRGLVDLITGAPNAWALIPFALIAALIAPLFEEFLFRGTLLPWMGHRLQGPLGAFWGWTLALLGSSLAFGLIHLEPAALPTLSVLGSVLGLAFLRSGSLPVSVLMHGAWNGGILLFYRALMT